jgi:hypothetical protein
MISVLIKNLSKIQFYLTHPYYSWFVFVFVDAAFQTIGPMKRLLQNKGKGYWKIIDNWEIREPLIRSGYRFGRWLIRPVNRLFVEMQLMNLFRLSGE